MHVTVHHPPKEEENLLLPSTSPTICPNNNGVHSRLLEGGGETPLTAWALGYAILTWRRLSPFSKKPKAFSSSSSLVRSTSPQPLSPSPELEAAVDSGTRAVSLSVDSPTAELGRGDLSSGGSGPSPDRTVSRRHVSLRFLGVGGGVAFEVVGKNPVVVRSPDGGGGSGTRSVFRRGEKGELRDGDALSLSLRAPAFWAVRARAGNGDGDADADVEPAVLDAVARRTRERKERERERRAAEVAMEVTEEEEGGALASDVGGFDIDLADIDPVREFGFLSMGHEFDIYPKGRIRAPKDWNWFLEETKRSSDDEVSSSRRRGRSKGQSWNKKKDGEGEDEDWTGESEDEKESLERVPTAKRPKYETRSKGPDKPSKENSKVGSGKSIDEDEGAEDEKDEQDETLGGFLVNDEDDEPMEELSDEEEEFDDEEDDD